MALFTAFLQQWPLNAATIWASLNAYEGPSGRALLEPEGSGEAWEEAEGCGRLLRGLGSMSRTNREGDSGGGGGGGGLTCAVLRWGRGGGKKLD